MGRALAVDLGQTLLRQQGFQVSSPIYLENIFTPALLQWQVVFVSQKRLQAGHYFTNNASFFSLVLRVKTKNLQPLFEIFTSLLSQNALQTIFL